MATPAGHHSFATENSFLLMVAKSLVSAGVSLITAVTVLVSSCQRAPAGQTSQTALGTFLFSVHSGCPIDSVDVFVYSDEGIRQLDSYCRLAAKRSVTVRAGPGDKTFVFLANVPGSIATDRLRRFDAMEALSMRYAAESAASPLLSGIYHSSSGPEGTVELKPLLCPIIIGTVRNALDAPLEAPVLCLKGVNAHTEILRSTGFRPSETLDSPDGLRDPAIMMRALPFDAVDSPIKAGITIYSYPNDVADATTGALPTSICMAGRLRGEECMFEAALPAIERGDTLRVDLEIDSGGRLQVSVIKL